MSVADLRAALDRAVGGLSDVPVEPTLERPKQTGHGDFATNAALLLTKPLGRPPREIADDLAARLRAELGAALEQVEVAGPGFLNLFLADAWFVAALDRLQVQPRPSRGVKVDVEFVSANPTGPLHLGHARNAAFGDALSRLLEFDGWDVAREYYVNDYGSQVVNFAKSVQARARGEEVPEDGYRGEYVGELAGVIDGAEAMDLEQLGLIAVERMLERIRATLERFRVHHDVWFSERSLHEGSPSELDHALDVLRAQGQLYEDDGALWVRTTDFGDDKDRVVVRSSGEHTYFGSDIAYAVNTRERGFARMIKVWGADHHGYVVRNKAAYRALGGDPDDLELLIMQFVHLAEGGSMSKRTGSFETLDDLVEAVGVDAARWFLLNRSHDTTIEFDLDLAVQESSENPVYYVQYAHARIASVRRKAGEERVNAAQAAGRDGLPELHPSERALVLKLLAFGDEAAEAAERRAPHRISAYALELAQAFTAFYRDCQVVGAEPDVLESFRLALCVASQDVLARSLGLLGVSAPDEM